MTNKAIADGLYVNDRRVFTPGMGWTMPWYYDPTGERERQNKHVMIPAAEKGKLGFLSTYYWRDWADIRPPLCIVCPNGETWEADRKASNGEGWEIRGEWPNLTITPSIVVRGYHGFLTNGEFTPDLEGRGPIGIVQ